MSSTESPAPGADDLASSVEQDVSAWASSSRDEFKSREDYNLAICDRLAARGVPPLAAVVLRVGRWGNAGSITRDVQLWYSRLSGRLAAQEAQIPLGERRVANLLIEQLWATALKEVDARIGAPLREELASVQQALSERVQDLEVSAQQLVKAQQDLDAERANSAETRATMERTLEQLREQLDQAQRQLSSEIARSSETKLKSDEALKTLNASLEQERKAATAERALLMSHLDDARLQGRQWKKDAERTAARANELQASIDAQRAEVADLRTKLALSDQAAASAQREQEVLLAAEAERRKALEQQLVVAGERLAAATASLAAKKPDGPQRKRTKP